MRVCDVRFLSKMMVCFSLFIALTACQSTSNSANLTHVDDDTIDTTHPRAELILDTKRLVGEIAFTNIRFGTTVNFQRVELALQNVSGHEMALEYKIEWQDEQGFSVNQHSVWNPVKLGPREIRNIQSLGKVPEAWKIQLIIRYAP